MKSFNDVVDEILNNAKTGNLDDVLSKTKVYAEKATKKGAETIEISKKKIELLDCKTKLSKAYEKYGRLMFDLKDSAEPDEEKIESAVAEIQLQKMRTEMLEQEIGELREKYSEALD